MTPLGAFVYAAVLGYTLNLILLLFALAGFVYYTSRDEERPANVCAALLRFSWAAQPGAAVVLFVTLTAAAVWWLIGG